MPMSMSMPRVMAMMSMSMSTLTLNTTRMEMNAKSMPLESLFASTLMVIGYIITPLLRLCLLFILPQSLHTTPSPLLRVVLRQSRLPIAARPAAALQLQLVRQSHLLLLLHPRQL